MKLTKNTKIALYLHLAFLIIILFANSAEFGFILYIGGLTALITSSLIFKDIAKIDNSMSSKRVTVFLLNFLLFLSTLFFYFLSDIGVGEKGLLLLSIEVLYLIMFISTTIYQIILLQKNKNTKEKFNKKLNSNIFFIIFLILIIMSYGWFVDSLSTRNLSYQNCDLHVGIRDNSIIFNKDLRNNCVWNIALIKVDSAICQYIDKNETKDSCITGMAVSSNNLELCEKINDKEGVSWCKKEIAYNLSDYSICKNLTTSVKDTCYFDIGARYSIINSCLNIQKDSLKYDCIYSTAQELNDPKICEQHIPQNGIVVKDTVVNNEFYDTYNYSISDCLLKLKK